MEAEEFIYLNNDIIEKNNQEDFLETENTNNNLLVSNKSKKNSGRKLAGVWKYFDKGDALLTSRGHYSATCILCGKYYQKSQACEMEAYLALECKNIEKNIRLFYLNIISKRDETNRIEATMDTPDKNLDNILITENNNKKRKLPSNQKLLSSFYESTELTNERKNAINQTWLRATVTCNLSYKLIKNPFFIEFLKELCSAYDPPSQKLVSGKLFDEELVQITLKINKLIQQSENLTLGILNILIF